LIIYSIASPTKKLFAGLSSRIRSPSSKATVSVAAGPFGGAFPFPTAATGAASVYPLRICSKLGFYSETNVVGHCPLFYR
jgi:hypothetical protein